MSKIDEIINNSTKRGNYYQVAVSELEQLRPYVELGEYIKDNENNVIDWGYLLGSKTQKIYADKINSLIQQIKEQEGEVVT